MNLLERIAIPNGKTIRDAVHGDIFVSGEFLRIIDTPEFQRLHRIRQLSTAYSLFPTAQHTRFSHSIGTYHVMQLLIKHFKPILELINLKIDKREIQLALGVALLHDIGHGPFSHAFEGALPVEGNQKKHEEWTIDIVTSAESHIQKVLVKSFDEKFPEDLAELIKKERDVKKHRKEFADTDIDLFFIISSLISSQLDADRMDYLLRDALFTGVSYGKFDISRLISSLTVTVHNNKYYVCVQEKYLSTIEEYLLARYQMHEGVYLHSFKCEMELIVKKILYRAFEMYHQRVVKQDDLPKALVSVFEGNDMSVNEYISLDDNVMLSLFTKWKQSPDDVLSFLCTSFLDREKYKQLAILDNTDDDIKEFKDEFVKTLGTYNYEVKELDNEFFWLEDKVKNETYKDRKDNIWVLRKNGTVCDLFEISRLITDKLKYQKNLVFINLDILRKIKGIKDVESAIDDVNNLVKLYNSRNHIEIEKKYLFEKEETFKKVISAIADLKQYTVDDSEDYVIQTDYYFDTPDKMLYNSDKTLRIREKSGTFYLTIKTPTKGRQPDGEKPQLPGNQTERFEYETEIPNNNLEQKRKYILKYIPELGEIFEQLITTLVIRNERKKVKLTYNQVKFEMACDNVTYKGEKQASEFEIEIELKSDFLHRVNLKMLSDHLESRIQELIPTTISKYKRGLQLTN